MKKLLIALGIAAALIYGETLYPQALEVVDVNDESDVLTLENWCGFRYQMRGAEDYNVGEIVSAIMFNAGTPDDIRDDLIMSARYSGYNVTKAD